MLVLGAAEGCFGTEKIDRAIDSERRAFELEAPTHVLTVVFGIDDDFQAIEVIGAIQSSLQRVNERADDLGEVVCPDTYHWQPLPFEFNKPFHVATIARQPMVSQHG